MDSEQRGLEEKGPELARKIRGADGEEGFAEGSDGMSLYAYLRERGSALQPHVQSEMETESSGPACMPRLEAHSKSQSKTIYHGCLDERRGADADVCAARSGSGKSTWRACTTRPWASSPW